MTNPKPNKLTMDSEGIKSEPKPPPLGHRKGVVSGRPLLHNGMGNYDDDDEFYFGLNEEDIVGFTPGDQ